MNVAVSDRQPCFGGASGQVVGTRAVRHETRGPLSMDGHRHWGTLPVAGGRRPLNSVVLVARKQLQCRGSGQAQSTALRSS